MVDARRGRITNVILFTDPESKAEKAIDRQIDATITSDWDAARTAVNLGKPIGDVKPKSALVADVSTLVDKMMPDAARQPVQQVAGKRKAK